MKSLTRQTPTVQLGENTFPVLLSEQVKNAEYPQLESRRLQHLIGWI